jgi:hypothetical protein
MHRAIHRGVPLAALALAAPLLLSSSSEVSAGGPVPAMSPGPACQAPASAPRDRIRAADVAPADEDLVVLNGRGYNYGANPLGELDRIQVEALMTRVETLRR